MGAELQGKGVNLWWLRSQSVNSFIYQRVVRSCRDLIPYIPHYLKILPT